MSTREFQVEMLWDCRMGHKRQLGRHTTCQSCGKPKTEDDEYYMPDEGAYAPEVTDEALLADAKAGPNWTCKYCGCHERRNDDECLNCGVPQKDGDSEVWERDQKERFEAINPPPEPEPASVPVTRSPPERPARLLNRRTLLKGVAYLGGFLGLALAASGLVYACSPHPKDATVQRAHWERSVSLQKQVTVREDGWSAPAGSFDVHDEGQKFHHNDHRLVRSHVIMVPDHYKCGEDCTTVPRVCVPVPRVCRDVPRVCRDIPKNCTTTPRSCVKSNCKPNKNGFATCSETCTGGQTTCTGGGQACSGGGQTCTGGGQSCTGGQTSCSDRYCDRVLPKTIDDYQDFPIYATYFSWSEYRWVLSRVVPAAGDEADPKWPEFSLGEAERESGRNESFAVTFVLKKGETKEWKPAGESDFRRFGTGSRWTLHIDSLGAIHSVEPK